MSNSSLASYTKLTKNYSTRTGTIDRITIHHMAGFMSAKECADYFYREGQKEDGAEVSANYCIGSDGKIALSVEEKNRAWTSGGAKTNCGMTGAQNDHRAVTIEVANCKGAPNWEVSDAALAATVKLCVDICKRNGIKKLNYTGDARGSLTKHNMFSYTDCPGPYLESKFSYIEKEVNRQLTAAPAPAPAQTQAKVLYRVRKNRNSPDTQLGAFADYRNAVKLADKNPGYSVFDATGKKLYSSKSITDVAKEVLAGKWGNGAVRKMKLTAAGYNYDSVQKEVNRQLGIK